MTGKRPPYHEAFINLALDGLSTRAIAEKLGIGRKTVSAKMYVLREQGVLPRPRTFTAEVRLGNLDDVLNPLEDQVQRWLITQTPKGGTVSDAIRAMVVDAYFDATEG